MEPKVRYTLSYPDSKKIVEESFKRDEAIRKLSGNMFDYNIEQTRKAINKLLFETAEQLNVSLYHLCFHTIPEVGPVEWDDDMKACQQTISLSPVDFDLTHDGGYWKEKYYDLKNKMRDLIDNK